MKKALLAVALLIFFLTGVFQHISDSEFWPMSLARLIGQSDSSHSSLIYKFVFLGLLKIPYLFDFSSVEHILATRVIFSLLGIANLLFFYKISKKLYQDDNVAFVLTALLFSSLFYFSQWSRIRSDLLVMFFCLLGIYLNLWRPSQKMRIAVLTILPLLMIFSTPKAIYWIVILTIFCWPGILYLSLPLLGICFLFIFSSLIYGSHIFLSAYSSAFFYYMNSWITVQQDPSVFTYEIGAFLKVHFVQITLSTMGIIVYFRTHKNLKNKIILGFFVAFLSLLANPQKLPFFICALLPFLILPAGFLLLRLPNRLYYYGVIALLILQGLGMSSWNQWWVPNKPELDKLSEIEGLIKKVPQATYFDGLGILPRQNLVYSYLGPDDPVTIQGAQQAVLWKKPSFIFRNSRSYLMEPILAIQLEKDYIEIRKGVFVRKEFKTQFDIDLSGMPLQNYFSFEARYY